MSKPDELRPHDTVRSQLRIPAELHERLKVVCNATGRSMNAEIVRRLEDSFDGKLRLELPEELLAGLQQEASRHRASIETLIRWRLEESKARESRDVTSSTRQITHLANQRAEQLRLMSSVEEEMQRARDAKASTEDASEIEAQDRELEILSEVYTAIETEATRTTDRIVKAVWALKRDRHNALTDSNVSDAMNDNSPSDLREYPTEDR